MWRVQLQHLLWAVVFVYLVALERTLGLPVLGLSFGLNKLSDCDDGGKLLWSVWMAFCIGALYQVSLALVLAVLLGAVLFLETEWRSVAHKSHKLFIAVVVSVVVIGVGQRVALTVVSLSYLIGSLLVLFLILGMWSRQRGAAPKLQLKKHL